MVAAALGIMRSPGKKKLPNKPQWPEKPEFRYHDLKQKGTTPSPSHPLNKGRGMIEPDQPMNIKAKKKVYRSDTGGTMKVLKGSLDPSKHDSSRLKHFS